jgi:DNA-binding NarL/FixJ family response regulator
MNIIRKLLPIISTIFALTTSAQIPTLRNFSPIEYNGGTQNWQIGEIRDNLMAFANNHGLIVFDGENWQIHPVANYTSVRSLAFDAKKLCVYAGASDEFGYFDINTATFNVEYHSLSKLLPANMRMFGEIWKIHLLPSGEVLFQGRAHLFSLRKGNKLITLKTAGAIDNSSLVGDRVYVSTKTGIYIYHGGKLSPLPGTGNLTGKRVSGVVQYNGKVMFVTMSDGLFIYDGHTATPFELDISPLLKDNNVFCAAAGKRYIGFGTIKNGLIVKDLQTGSNYYVNTNTGLQNNTVLSMSFDSLDNIWLGLDMGLSYVMLESSYGNLLGANNTIGTGYTSAISGNQLYMGTNQGLFSIPFPLQNSILPPKAQTVEGVVGQIWSLQNIDGTLLCGANDGAYIVGAGTVRRIDGLGGTWGFRKLNDHPGYLLTCDYDGLAVLKQEGGSITLHSRLSNFHEASGNFEQDSDGSIWLSHWHKGVWHFRLSDDMTRVENLEYYHNGAGLVVDDNNLVCKIDGRVYVSSVDGFHQYDERNRKLKHCDWMNNLFNTYGEALHVTQAPDGMIIAYKADYLAVAERQHNGKYQSRQVGYGNMVQQMQMGLGNIGFLENRQIVLNSNNGFFVMRPQKKDAAKTNHVMVSRIYSTNTGDTLVYMRCPELVKEEVVLPHSLNSIRIEYVMPEYRGEKGVLYSCYLEGYEKEMSTMSHSSSKEYTKLEKGKYIFHVKARNLVDGTESESQIVIRILPAWYETWWAYLLYIILIVTGMWALLRYMNLRAEKELRKVKKEKERQMKEQQMEFHLAEEKKEKELAKLRSKQLEVELKHKSSELSDSAMNLVRKNDMLQAIDQNMEQLSESVRREETKARLVKKIGDIRKEIKMHMNDDDNWNKFEENFNLVYDNFSQKIMEAFPQLKKSDLKLCVYLRMGLSSKEMASLLNTSVRSIETARYRLRKKLDIDTGSNLTDFIQSFGN